MNYIQMKKEDNFTEQELLEQIEKEGYRYSKKPKTVFIPFFIAENLTYSMINLRRNYGYMIQTEIV